MRKIKMTLMIMAIATAGFASEGTTSKVDKISGIKNFFAQNQVYNLTEKRLQQLSDEKLNDLYQETAKIKKDDFSTSYKEDQINIMADLLGKVSLNPEAHEVLVQYGMARVPSEDGRK